MNKTKILALIYKTPKVENLHWHAITSAFAGQLLAHDPLFTLTRESGGMLAVQVRLGFVDIDYVLEELVKKLDLHAAIMYDPYDQGAIVSQAVTTTLAFYLNYLRTVPETNAF